MPIDQALPDPAVFLERAEREANAYTPSTETSPTEAPQAKPSSTVAASRGARKIVAVTACPTGVAHTFMAAGMVPAIGMGIASSVARAKFSEPEREAGKASFMLGFCFISEGAIPFAAKDPLRVIPVCMVGGAITGALSMLVGAKLMAPHGGIFVLLIPNAISPALLYLGAISPALLYLGAIVIGSLVTGLGYAAIKRGGQPVPVSATA